MPIFKRDPLQIITFNSYGSDAHFYLRGRALEDESIDLEDKSWFRLLINTWKRLESDEVRNTRLEIKLPNGSIVKTKTNYKGYFKVKADLENLKQYTCNDGWLTCEIAYSDLNLKREIQNNNKFPVKVLIPSKAAEFGVISDIDDTILYTGVASTLKWRLLFNTFFKAAKSRLPLEGAAEFYQMLHRGVSKNSINPIFYVSHSPWNLYRYLELFLKQNDFPKGPILLRSFGDILKRKPNSEKPRKQREILNVLKTYPDLSFILIGDSGEHDPDIYIEIAEQFPDRIKAIYLRSVNHKKKIIRVKGLLDNYKTTPALLVESSEQAITHARNSGFIK